MLLKSFYICFSVILEGILQF